jgi:L-asparaginase
MRIKIFTTGGSIDKYYATEESAFVVGDPAIARILDEGNVTLSWEIEPLFRKDSLDITDEDRLLIVERVKAVEHTHIIITHGTDTMIDTARALSAVQGKTIVLTGAMQPAAFRQTDAGFNVGCAFLAVQLLPDGVYIAMNGRLFDPREATKNVTMARFERSQTQPAVRASPGRRDSANPP